MAHALSFDFRGLVPRFLRYARIDTQSNPEASGYPSTLGQLAFGKLLLGELQALGVKATQDSHGYVMGWLPGVGALAQAERMGFVAHMDTSPDAPGQAVKPRVVRFNGCPIALGAPGMRLDPKIFPELMAYRGEEIVVSDGSTLLGADDKAGIAAIMEAVAYWVGHPELPRRPVAVAFTLDEELGRGVEHFDLEAFGASLAYTVDGGEEPILEHENFNAAEARVTITGRSIHPGAAKGHMVNALELGMRFHALLPPKARPEYTEGYEGFYHLDRLEGSVAQAQLHYIVREHQAARFEQMKQSLVDAAVRLNGQLGYQALQVELEDQYYNMAQWLSAESLPVKLGLRAITASGLPAQTRPIRGGTDGALLTAKGLPCPNLFTGGRNYHSVYEYLPVRPFQKACEVVTRLPLLD